MNINSIEVNGLRKSFGKQIVLDGIDLAVAKGTIFALLGPNGAGKTTLINILSTLSEPDEGFARIEGYDVVSNRYEVRRSISLTGQFAAVDEVLTGHENIIMMCRLSGLSRGESRLRTAELLKRFDLEDAAGKRVKTFSGGMRRRLDLAVSLVVNRPVLFLDEPTTGLDTVSRRSLWEIILRLKQQGMTIFLTTQYLEEADQLADEIAVMGRGRIVATGSAEALKARVGGEVIELRNHMDEVIRSIPTSGSVQDVRHTLSEIAHLCPPDTRLFIRKPSMDDVFLALTSIDQKEASLT
ncbi:MULTISPECIES: ATP-binding cassette domain-containing protein [unclassified Paenibacillus]|uniref:ATP-binding cassette domain-containing protein n=1 Tax=unclassified Paenibacillus TaxID=185978 RepID=UPI0027852C61|nr:MULTISPECIES: ATP-binding cassette domain-containing protein [unclassified Paenibacillus]MDQ0900767.1 ABC-2 type transport system ATP-binding protein [Paenibacillus sp. V4I7]MDQ0920725.1 ABC-2 type transport system ATP-binding protein [Paenibacillus sp. V4I5]